MTDIVFMTPFTGINDTDITDFAGLNTLGDEMVTNLVKVLNGSSPINGTTHSRGGRLASPISAITLLIFVSTLSIALLGVQSLN